MPWPRGPTCISTWINAITIATREKATTRISCRASVTRHRYWSATVDGNPARLAPVNIAYQGVVLEKGRHEVVMKYRNPLVPPLALLSLFTLASCLVAAAIPRRRSVSRTITS